MGLGVSWTGAYPQPQKNEQYYLMFINLFTTIQKTFPRIISMGLDAPGSDAYLQHQKKEQSSVMFINLETNKSKNIL